jgi:hypothetical protein
LKLKKQRMLGRIMTLVCVSATMSYAANTRVNVTSMGIQSETTELTGVNTVYKHMSTPELEKEIERLTVNGDVPFEMGVELMKRWTKG